MEPSTLDPTLRESVTAEILSRLGRRGSEDDLVLWVCNQTGLQWDAAQNLVDNVRLEHYQEIDRRRKPLLVALQVLIIVIGVALSVAPLLIWGEIVQLDGGSAPQTVRHLKLAFDHAGGWVMIIFGVALVILGAWRRQQHQRSK